MAAREPFNVTSRVTSTSAQHSPWHSPVPYLFGGLAAMLGLIAFALLILACSYWKLSGYLESEQASGGRQDRDLEAGDGKVDGDDTEKNSKEENVLVIMAGEVKPTFLAIKVMSTSFGDDGNENENENNSSCSEKINDKSDYDQTHL